MDEYELEKHVGDISTRYALIQSILQGDCTEVAYGNITLRQVENGNILPVDFDGHVYELIEVDTTLPIDDRINKVMDEADSRISKLYEEL